MKMFNTGLSFLKLLPGILLMVLAASCINDYGDCPEEDQGDGLIHLSFTVVTKTVSQSRADDDCIEDFQGTAPEDFMNINNFMFLVYDNGGNFLSDITTKSHIVTDFSNPDLAIYKVVARLDDPYFTEAVANPRGNINFSILVLANYDGWDAHFPLLQEGQKIDDIFDDGVVMSTVPDARRMLEADTDAPDRLCFPMAAVQSFSVNPRNLQNSSEDLPYDISGGTAVSRYLNLLRAVAKIEVIDKINMAEDAVFTEEDADSPLRIAAATLNGYMNKGSLLPARNQWPANLVVAGDNADVTAPTIPALAAYVRPPALLADNTYGTDFDTDYSLNFAYDAAATARRDDKCPVYSCYVFEYTQGTIPANQQPYVRITTKGSDEYEPANLPMRLAYYTGETPDANREFLLRNHIYRYEITGISQEVQFNWTVCPMDGAQSNIVFN